MYFADDCCSLPNLADDNDWLDQLFPDNGVERFVSRVYKGAYKDGSFDKKRVSQYAKAFSKGIMEGYTSQRSGNPAKVEFSDNDQLMLSKLRDNVFHFSAAKNRTEIVALSGLLRDDKGNLRSYKSFVEEAKKVTSEFQGRYMRVEYDLAVNAATTAARWAEYPDDVVLVYQTAHDGRVRPEHAALDGVSKPKSDSFWNTYYPPNGWNCRCTTVVTHSGRITPDNALPPGTIDGVPPMFRSNFAKEGMVFPPKHPYYKNDNRITDLLLDKMDTTPKVVDTTPDGNKVWESNASHKYSKSATEMARIKREYKQNRIVAKLMADRYKDDVLLLPELSKPKEDPRYVWNFLSKGYKHEPSVCDSLLVNKNIFYEVKSYEGNYGYDKMTKMMNHMMKQADTGVLYINQDIPLEKIKSDFQSYLKMLNKSKKEVKMDRVYAVINGRLETVF